ncbi:hypothetical protein Ancab_020342 [Ancistrocladus abbreviatus]
MIKYCTCLIPTHYSCPSTGQSLTLFPIGPKPPLPTPSLPRLPLPLLYPRLQRTVDGEEKNGVGFFLFCNFVLIIKLPCQVKFVRLALKYTNTIERKKIVEQN